MDEERKIEITLTEREEEMLDEILAIHNKGLGPKTRKTKTEYFEDLVREAIYFKWKMLRG
jgi:hypothetical protein